MTKIKAKYIGEDDPEFKKGEIYTIYPIKGIHEGDLIAAENIYGEAYVMPLRLFEKVES